MVESSEQDSSSVHRQEVDVSKHPITDVSLFSRQACRAEVRRPVKVDLKAGANELVILNLPSLLEDTIQLAGTGEAHVVIHSVNYSARPVIPESTSGELERLEDEEKRIKDALAVKTAAFDALSAYVNSITAEFIKPSELDAGVASVEGYLADRQKARRALEKEAKDIQDKITEEKARLQQKGEDNSQLGYQLSVPLAAQEAGTVELVLSYAVSGPYFSPRYIVQCSSSDSEGQSEVKLLYKATVSQATGEPWNNVNLKLETSKPLPSGQQLPILRAQNLSFREAIAFASSDAVPRMMMAAAAPAPPGGPPQQSLFGAPRSAKRKDVHAEADVSESGSSQSFVIPGRPTISADGSERTLTIAELTLPAEFYRAAVPKINTQCFLKARISNKSVYVLLPGETTVTLDGAFVASNSLRQSIQPNERFEAHVGADPTIKLTCSPIRKTDSKQSRLFGGDRASKQVAHRIHVKNTGRQKVKVAIFDQVAQSRNEQISVEVIEPAELGSPPTSAQADAKLHHVAEGVMASWARHNEEEPDASGIDTDGRLRFDVVLAPSDSKVLDVAYKVSWPSSENLVGI